MLSEYTSFKRVILAAGKTDLRKGADSLAQIVQIHFQLNPYEKDVLFMFCGTGRSLIKCLVWEGDGFLLLTKRLQDGKFQWPRTKQEAMELTPEQYRNLLSGLSIVSTIRKTTPTILLQFVNTENYFRLKKCICCPVFLLHICQLSAIESSILLFSQGCTRKHLCPLCTGSGLAEGISVWAERRKRLPARFAIFCVSVYNSCVRHRNTQLQQGGA